MANGPNDNCTNEKKEEPSDQSNEDSTMSLQYVKLSQNHRIVVENVACLKIVYAVFTVPSWVLV